MQKLAIIFLCLLSINSYAREKLMPTISGRVFSFSTVTIPERASVAVKCFFDMHKDYTEEFYAYVTPYAGKFHVMEEICRGKGGCNTNEIGSKVYMPRPGWLFQIYSMKTITITGVSQATESIIIDLTHTPSKTTVDCSY